MVILNLGLTPVNRTRFLIIFSLLIAVSACGSRVKTPADTLIVGLETAPLTLDPRLASDAVSSKIVALTHNGLFRMTERLELLPDLVETFDFVPPLKYRFRVKKGILFHDGRELTTDDIRGTLESIQDPSLASPFRGSIGKIQSIRIIDRYQFEMTLREPFAPLLSALTVGIVPVGGENPRTGTGPFIFESFDPARRILLARNESFFRGVPKIKHLLFQIISDDNLRVLELKNHRIDLLQNNVPPPLLKILKQEKGLVIEKTGGIHHTYLGLNLRKAPLDRLEVRQAIAHALDVPALVSYRLSGLAQPATGLLAPIHWAYESEVDRYPYDPKKARELLDRAGFSDPDGGGPLPRFSLTYKTSTKKDRIGLARQIARYLREVGIDTKILPEWGDFDLYSLTWVGVTDPDIYFHLFHSQNSPKGANQGGYANPVIDRLTEEGRRVMNRPERRDIYSAVQKVLAQDLPVIPLWHEENFAVFSDRVKGLRLRPNASFEWATEVIKE